MYHSHSFDAQATRTPESVERFLTADQLKLYKLIWERFIASQMLPAVYDVTQVEVESSRYLLRASGRVLRSAGFLAVYREITDEETSSRTISSIRPLNSDCIAIAA